MTGSVPDALAFINYLDKQMTRATLTSLLDMTDSTHGNRALGETFMDLLLMSLQTIADETAAESTAQLVIPLVNANYGEDEPAPRIVCGDVGSEHEVTAQTLQLLLSSGAIEPDPALDAYVRNQYKLPERDAAYPWAPPHSVPDPMTAVPTGAEPFLDLTPGA
jgi:phage gp29-like protein